MQAVPSAVFRLQKLRAILQSENAGAYAANETTIFSFIGTGNSD